MTAVILKESETVSLVGTTHLHFVTAFDEHTPAWYEFRRTEDNIKGIVENASAAYFGTEKGSVLLQFYPFAKLTDKNEIQGFCIFEAGISLYF